MVQKLDIGGLFQERNQTLTFTALDAAGAVMNLTGLTVKWAIALANTATSPLLSKSSAVAGEITISAPTTGVFVVNLTAVDTLTLSGQYYYETVVIDPVPNPDTIAQLHYGTLEFRPTIIAAP